MSDIKEAEKTDSKGIDFYKEQLSSLRDMMSRTTCYMESLKSELQNRNNEIQQSVNYAKGIQQNLLPQGKSFCNHFDQSYCTVKQRDGIGGDMIYAREFGDAFVFALMDCTGHGIPGALISMLGYTFLDRTLNANNAHSPALVLKEVDQQFKDFFGKSNGQMHNDGMDGVLCSYHKETKSIRYSMAGRPIWFNKNNEWIYHRPAKSSIGGSRNKSFETESISLNQGDEIFLFSDGLADQFGGPKDKKFLTKRIKNALEIDKKLTLEERFQKLFEKVVDWQGKTEQTDDISLLALKV